MVWITGMLGLLVGVLLGALYARHALRGVRRELEGWRAKSESALLERTKFESEATRVPALEARIEGLLADLSRVSADNAQARARLEEKARAPEKKWLH
jgi:uncharacterized membrane-anchored protein YhcB (DUF1043 family)